MSHGLGALRQQIGTATDLQGVVRTMKALAASSITQYEQSVAALMDYRRTIELGLGACLRQYPMSALAEPQHTHQVRAIVFGSDQGLVGPFNDLIVEHALNTLAPLGPSPRIWAVGERVQASLLDAGQPVQGMFRVPVSVEGIAPLVGQIAVVSEASASSSLYLFYHRPGLQAIYRPIAEQVLPLDTEWAERLAAIPWPSKQLTQVLGTGPNTLRALIREYLFVSVYRACAESLASENASRLAAMQRADQNIDELLTELRQDFHRLRQNAIDEELFDVISSYEVLS